MRETLMRTGIGAVMCLGAMSGSTASADQEYAWEHSWTYIMGPIFDDFHATYSGTGGTIDREVMTMDTAGGGVITGELNMIHIVWPPTWVIAGDMFEYQFNTAHPEIAFVSGSITKGGVVIGVFGPDGIIHDPQSPGQQIGHFEHEFVPAPGALALLIVGGVFARRRRAA